jgi:hypothetical protein
LPIQIFVVGNLACAAVGPLGIGRAEDGGGFAAWEFFEPLHPHITMSAIVIRPGPILVISRDWFKPG